MGTIVNPFSLLRCCCCLIWRDRFVRPGDSVGVRYKEYEVDALGDPLGDEAGSSVWEVDAGKAITYTAGQSIAIDPANLILYYANEFEFEIETDGVVVVELFGARHAFDAVNGEVRYYTPEQSMPFPVPGPDDPAIPKRKCSIGSMPLVASFINSRPFNWGTVPPDNLQFVGSLHINGSPVWANGHAWDSLYLYPPRVYLESGTFAAIHSLRVIEHGPHYEPIRFLDSKKVCPDNTSLSWFPVGDVDEITVTISGIQQAEFDFELCDNCESLNGTYVLQRDGGRRSYGSETYGVRYSLPGSFGCANTLMEVDFIVGTGFGAYGMRITWSGGPPGSAQEIFVPYYPYDTVIPPLSMYQNGSYVDRQLPCGNTLNVTANGLYSGLLNDCLTDSPIEITVEA